MRKQVVHVAVHQTSKVIATMYAIITFLIAIAMAIYTFFQTGDIVTALLIVVIMPIFYWILFYITHVIALFFYNIVAKRLGGIEFDLEDSGMPMQKERIMSEPMNPDRIDKM